MGDGGGEKWVVPSRMLDDHLFKFKLLLILISHISGHHQFHSAEVVNEHFLKLPVLVSQVEEGSGPGVHARVEYSAKSPEAERDSQLSSLDLKLKLLGDWQDLGSRILLVGIGDCESKETSFDLVDVLVQPVIGFNDDDTIGSGLSIEGALVEDLTLS